MDEDYIGFSYFVNLCYKEHTKNNQDDNIKFNDFYIICHEKWESLDKESKEKIFQIAKSENIKNYKCNQDLNHINDILQLDEIINEAKKIKINFDKLYSFSKKSRNSYIYFIKSARNAIKLNHPNARGSFIEINNAILTKYRECLIEDKKVFEELSLLDSKFNNRIKNSNSFINKNKTKNNTTKKLNGYLIYCRMNRKKISEKNPNLKMVEITSLLASQWKELSQDLKENYNKIADKHKNCVKNTDLFLKAKAVRNEIEFSFNKTLISRLNTRKTVNKRKRKRKTKKKRLNTTKKSLKTKKIKSIKSKSE